MAEAGLEDLGFVADYKVERDPAFPGTGVWPEPVYTFDDRDIRELGPADAPIGDMALRVTPISGSPWVGFFSGSLAGINAVSSSPNPTLMGVIQAGDAWLVDVLQPRRSMFISAAIHSVHRIRAIDAVILASDTVLIAVGPTGVLWRSSDLCTDNLQVVDAAAAGIRCTGLMSYERIESFSVEASTGQRIHKRWNPFKRP